LALSDYPTGAQQENILTLLCFDATAAPLIRAVVDVELFESAPFREVASQAVTYLDQFKEPIGEHLPDALEHVLEGNDKRKARIFDALIDNLFAARQGLNKEYVLSGLRIFVRQQQLKLGVTEAAKELQRGDIDQVAVTLNAALRSSIKIMDPGLVVYKDARRALNFFDITDNHIHTNIEYFNKIGIGPTPGELLTILAATGRGKSWGLTHLGKYALLQRHKVCHITLEMGEASCAMRYMQSMFSVSRRESSLLYPSFDIDDHGNFESLAIRKMERPTLKDRGIQGFLRSRLNKMASRLKLVIKKFPTNSLTMAGLRAYLDQLEMVHGFIPDVLIVDYADLMHIGDSAQVRSETGQIYKDLRGIADERNLALCTASQSNRLGEGVRLITLKHFAEDYSKAATSDIVLSYNQTDEEKELGLARLFVAKNRDEESGRTVLVSQNYHSGQFALDSCVLHHDRYWDAVDRETRE
jgi:hypothetical protein